MKHAPVVLMILDGWGLRDAPEGNAPRLAATPAFDGMMARCPSAQLSASGEDVGLPAGQMGNSEVGHTNIGAGRVVWMDLPRIDRAIADGSFAERPALRRFAEALEASGGAAHLVGLLSPGGVHSHQDHLAEAANLLAARGIPVRLHLILDGRDTPPKAAPGYLETFLASAQPALAAGAEVATVIGRFYALDRDNRWERVSLAAAAMLRGEGDRAESAAQAIAAGHARGESDEFVRPAVIGSHAGMADGDGLFCLNFRADRAREILGALADPAFDGFDTGPRPALAARLGMVSYSERLDGIFDVVFPQEPIPDTLGAWVAGKGLRQFRLAETEKYPHVTFFLNGGVEPPYPGEERHMAPSPKVATYDLAPEMAAAEVTEALVAAIGAGYDLIVVNYANPDMVGHSGDLAAAIRACEAVDAGLGAAIAAIEAGAGAMLVTADHGNCEVMIDPASGGPHTAHTLNPVPLALVQGKGAGRRAAGLRAGRLADLAPSLLDLMGLDRPAAMTGQSLIDWDGA
ncbi:2,3-bisphosphoglycerate-independent phosphoglycerate mutase [Paralimibaculum aggregatum]|uniref:2,3-bisphosphoglycerate-independent phosphoglycerate mutase n=1 Tax=Paralimibaculum aggregatum TaxID=3036245 RepID=A0ABQ6LPR6_9RHOB|nr:2,3-bisphosphoglycerate-independent phosphoglycerate mutase [Limibaculum sp. NKW23]GMG82491.1 2,3-bisphosphoglycerate-independent phosphoglycerate mutase [Limibaculum sp. NKW23]